MKKFIVRRELPTTVEEYVVTLNEMFANFENGNSATIEWVDSPLTKIVKNGGVVKLNEINVSGHTCTKTCDHKRELASSPFFVGQKVNLLTEPGLFTIVKLNIATTLVSNRAGERFRVANGSLVKRAPRVSNVTGKPITRKITKKAGK